MSMPEFLCPESASDKMYIEISTVVQQSYLKET